MACVQVRIRLDTEAVSSAAYPRSRPVATGRWHVREQVEVSKYLGQATFRQAVRLCKADSYWKHSAVPKGTEVIINRKAGDTKSTEWSNMNHLGHVQLNRRAVEWRCGYRLARQQFFPTGILKRSCCCVLRRCADRASGSISFWLRVNPLARCCSNLCLLAAAENGRHLFLVVFFAVRSFGHCKILQLRVSLSTVVAFETAQPSLDTHSAVCLWFSDRSLALLPSKTPSMKKQYFDSSRQGISVG